MKEAAATTPEVAVELAAEHIAGGAELIDVRTDEEWENARIPGAKHIRLEELPAHAAELDPGKELIIYCRSGSRSAMAAEALAGAGYDAHNLAGGIKAWAEAGNEIEPEGAEIP